MKNYTYGWELKDKGYVEIQKESYDKYQKEMDEFICHTSNVIAEAKCGWDGVKYVVMKHKDCKDYSEFMVLWVKGGGSRWIPITGNSKGCNFEVLGKNLW